MVICIAVVMLVVFTCWNADGSKWYPGTAVVLNQYAADDWNMGYGHWDISIVRKGEPMVFRLDGIEMKCAEITISYGPTNGDESPARLEIYPGGRKDRVPDKREVVAVGVSEDEIAGFLEWVSGDFANLQSYDVGRKTFSCLVQDGEFGIYSIEGERNCLTAAHRLLNEMNRG